MFFTKEGIFREEQPMSNKLIDLIDNSKSYGMQTVLDELNLYIREYEFLTLLGPSGCGKTTLVRILGGFETPDSGKVIFDGKDITNLAPNKRQLNTVFQKYALFTHMTIAENIAFGLKIKGKSKAYIQDKIKYALKLVNLDGFENRSADSLSGGQQQRIGIARALAMNPQIIFADEPTGNLDAKTTMEVLKLMQKVVREQKQSLVMATHDNNLATYADRIFKIIDGKIVSIEENHHEVDLVQLEESMQAAAEAQAEGNSMNAAAEEQIETVMEAEEHRIEG